MAPPTDALAIAGDAAPGLLGAAVRMVLATAAVALLAWAALRFQRRLKSPNRHLSVVDRAFLSRGVSVALVECDGRRLLLGVSGEGVRLIRDLDAGGRHRASPFEGALERATDRREATR